MGRVGRGVRLAEEAEAVHGVGVLAAGERPAALVADGVDDRQADDVLEALEHPPDDRAVRPRAGPRDVEVVAPGDGGIRGRAVVGDPVAERARLAVEPAAPPDGLEERAVDQVLGHGLCLPSYAAADAFAAAVRRSISRRTTGATSVPNSSIERMMLGVRQRADAELDQEALVAEDLVLEEDLLDHLLGTADEARAVEVERRVELRARHRRPPALAPDLVHDRLERGERLVGGRLRRVGDEAVRVDAQRRRRVAVLLRGAAVQLGERREALRLAADDRERHRQAERAGAHDRLRRAADRDPHGQRVLQRARVDALAVERRAVAAGPRDVLGLAQLEQELELLGEQLVVVLEVVAEQREGLDERAAARP